MIKPLYLNQNIKLNLSYVVLIFWMCLIFFLSAQVSDSSSHLSGSITEKVILTIEKIVPSVDFDLNLVHHYVRKFAHFFVYLILGVLMINVFSFYEYSKSKIFMISWIACFFYAMSDELHQMFVPGRGPAFFDVFIDSSGAGVGLCLYVLFRKLIVKYKGVL